MDIRLINLHKRYRSEEGEYIEALQGINLDLNAQNYLCFVGPSGSGKSSLLNCITGTFRPSIGDIYWGKLSLQNSSDKLISEYRRSHFGVVFQNPQFIPELTVEENILLPLVINGIDIQQKLPYLETLMEKFKIKQLYKRLPQHLSGGEQKKVSIVRALIHNPSVLIADEPTSNLDEQSSYEVFSIFYHLNEMGLTVIVATHDERFSKYAKEIYFLDNGKITHFESRKRKPNLV